MVVHLAQLHHVLSAGQNPCQTGQSQVATVSVLRRIRSCCGLKGRVYNLRTTSACLALAAVRAACGCSRKAVQAGPHG